MYDKSDIHFKSDTISLKSLGFEDFETDERTAFPFSGGENEALKRLHHYFSETKKLSQYKETRNGLVGTDYSSKFSLAVGWKPFCGNHLPRNKKI
jgi:deoxyribodipyrimidine photo-lyase